MSYEKAMEIYESGNADNILFGTTMYEIVKVVKGYEIKRMKGMRGAYHVVVREGKGFREFHTFRTIKAAIEFINTAL